MRVRDLLYETWSALSSNKSRSFLTILGIVIGISAVIAMTALIGGIKNSLVGELGLNQSRLVYIYVNATRPITFEDLDQIEKNVQGYEFVTGSVYGSATASTETKSSSASVEGVKPEYLVANGTKIVYGRSFTDAEEQSGAMLVIIDQNMVKSLFGNSEKNVVGQTIQIGNDKYSIVGISSNTSYGGSGSIFMPYTTACVRVVGTSAGIASIVGFAKEGTDIDALSADTVKYLKTYFHLEDDSDVEVMSMQSIVDQMNTMMTAFQVLMTAVASISLFVGGIGIMNMMLTNVTERIREIGLRKALGAKRKDITRQFLLESIMLCVVGGVFGILFGYLGSWVLAAFVQAYQEGFNVTPSISIGSVLFATAVCVIIGVAFGYYPARRAAKLDPVESLRYQ